MHLDVVDLRKFYHSTPLGRMVQRSLRERLSALKLDNVTVRFGDGMQGLGEYAPFDRIIVTAGVPLRTPGSTNMLRIAYIGADGQGSRHASEPKAR